MYIIEAKTSYRTLFLLLADKKTKEAALIDEKGNLLGTVYGVSRWIKEKNCKKATPDSILKLIVKSKDEGLRDTLKKYLKDML